MFLNRVTYATSQSRLSASAHQSFRGRAWPFSIASGACLRARAPRRANVPLSIAAHLRISEVLTGARCTHAVRVKNAER